MNQGPTNEYIIELEEQGICPDCGCDLDTGMGFGYRDMECSDDCGFSLQYPMTTYYDVVLPHFRR